MSLYALNMVVQLLLIRHAHPHAVTHNPSGADPGLTPEGSAQASRLADYLATKPFGEISYLGSSTMRRAVETAQFVQRVVGLEPVLDDRIVEVDSGWKTYGTGIGHYPNRRAGWDDLNSGRFGGNTFDLDQFRGRIVRGFDDIVARADSQSVVAVVCHGGVISAYLSHILGTARTFFVDTAYTSITRIHADGDYRELLSVNETDHLR